MAVQRGRKTPGTSGSRLTNAGADVVLPKRGLAGKAKAQRPGSDLDKGTSITNDLVRYTQNAISNVSTKTDITDIIRTLIREDGLFSAAANAMVAMSTGAGWRVAGYDSTGTMSLEVTTVAYQLLDRLSSVHDYSQGYNDKPGVDTLLAMLQMDVVTSGGCGVELVLDTDFEPDRLVPIGYSSITWVADGQGGRYPTQDSGEIELNIPTVFMAEHNRSPDEAYAVSLLRPGLNQTLNFNGFLEDMHRALNRVGHSRMVATIAAQKIFDATDEKTRRDPEKMAAIYASVIDEVRSTLASLEPEDAAVVYDSLDIKVHDTGGSKADYSSMLSTLGNQLGTSLKTPASVTGLRAAGGQGLSNAETLTYLKNIQATRPPVEEVMTRNLTLGVRLLGSDGYVKFEFLPIDLRPDSELEAYLATKQSRVLSLLSYGLINDAQACFELGLRPQGLQALLTGTGFMAKTSATETPAADRTTSSGAALAPDTPSEPGGA